MPKHPSVVVNRLQRLGQQWRAINVWDYDVSFVRNPAFPVASPRIVSIQSGTQIVLLRGNFQSRSATVPSPSMTVREINPVPSTISLENVLVQPDSPIVLFRLGRDEITALTILTTNSIGEAVRSPEGVWSPIREIAGTVPPLRRIWAAVAVSPNLADSYLFCVGEDHKLYVKIRKSGERWKDYREVARNVPRLHPFSNIAVSARYSSTNRTIIDVLFIDQDGILTVTTIQIIIEELALVSTIKLQQAPTLLFGSALALVTPVQLGHVLAFAIDNTLHMVMCYYDGQRWTTVNPIGRQNERVGPHARIATLAVSGNEVDVVTLTDVGDTALYILRWNGRTWVSDPRVVFPQPPPSGPTPAAPPPAAILAPAPGCRINPYGDIAVSRSPNSTVSTIYCAGLLNGSNNILTRELNPVNPNVGTWQFFL